MSTKRFTILAFSLLAVIAIACQKAPFLTMNGPRSYTFTREGGTQSFSFTCNRDWSVSSSESWIQVSPSSGTASDGEITVKFSCAQNTTYDPRSATITVKLEELSESITVIQETGIGLIVSPKTFELTNAEQTIEIEVQKNVQYTVAIDNESASWIKQGGTKALTTDKITFTIAANTSYDDREGKITFKQLDGVLSETVVVRQSQTNGLFITTPEYTLSNEAHTLSVEVKANVDFEVTSQADWITYVETKSLKASTITLTTPANEGYDNRTGTVLVKQKNGDLSGTITITQKQTDYLTVTPNSFDLDNKQHEIELKVTQNVAYSVVIPDDAKSWVYIPTKSITKGLVDDKIILVVEANSTYDDRETSVTIKQNDGSLAETVKIKQAYGEGLIIDKKEYTVNGESGSLEIDLLSNVEIDVKSEVDWIRYVQTKALDNKKIVLSIDYNNELKNRSGKVVVNQVEGPLTASIIITQIVPESVDLGLSVKWGSFNLKADKPEQFGGYYRWGETESRTDFSTSYKWGTINNWTKYSSEDGKRVLDLEDDAAYSLLGEKWRIPTDKELDELKNNCDWTWKSFNGVNGYIVESKINGNKIFLPAAGYYSGSYYYEAGYSGTYMSSDLKENCNSAESLFFNSSLINDEHGSSREGNGFSIRPVFGDRVHPSSVSLNKNSLSLCIGSYERLVATVSPNNATDQSTFWSSSNPSVASIDQHGIVKANSVGNATVTVKTIDGELVKSCEVTIVNSMSEPEAINLGLSVKWASWNVGASSPEGYGSYYAWGETEPKEDYSSSKYNTDGSLDKYSSNNKTVLEPSDDVAHIKLGGDWRMPSKAEWNELKDNCIWTWTTKNGVCGYLVTSNKNAANIFLPANGQRIDMSHNDVGSWGFYWSSSLNTQNTFMAYCLDFNTSDVGKFYADWYRRAGLCVRPVKE